MWGLRLAGASMVVTGIVLGVIGWLVPEARPGVWGSGGPIIVVGVLMATLLPRALGLGRAAALRKRGGQPGTARVLAVHDTGVSVNAAALFRVEAEVTAAGRPPYPASFRVPVPRTAWGLVRPGTVLPVLVDPADPRQVAYDDRAPGGLASLGPAAAAAAPGPATAVRLSAHDIAVRGQHAQATVLGAQPTGRTAADLGQAGLRASEADDPVAIVQLRVELATGAPFDATSAMRVPAGKEHLLKPGARVPVAYLVEDPTGTATIDWSRA